MDLRACDKVPGRDHDPPVPAAGGRHTFLPGHRIMVQVQSSWFPLYDRNLQTFVENIAKATPADYRVATQRIWLTPEQASFVELPVVRGDRVLRHWASRAAWLP